MGFKDRSSVRVQGVIRCNADLSHCTPIVSLHMTLLDTGRTLEEWRKYRWIKVFILTVH